MGILSYYFAMSIDGYIAEENDSLQWLEDFGNNEAFERSPYAYRDYYETVSSVIMGRRTYEVISRMGEYPYVDKKGYIVTNNVRYYNGSTSEPLTFLKDLDSLITEKDRCEGRMWLIGGGKLASELMRLQIIDELIITVIPKMLGSGIRWVIENDAKTEWFLRDSIQLGDVAQFQYIKK